MATTTTGQTNSVSFRQSVRQLIDSNLKQYFSNTLNKEPDIINIVMALIQMESSFRPAVTHATIPLAKSSTARDYFNSTAVSNVYKNGSAQQRANINEGLRAVGLMGVMMWNTVKGGSSSGRCLIEQARPDLVGQLCVNPGDSITAKYDGEANINTQILAGLVVLENKYKAVKTVSGGFQVGTRTYSKKITAALSAYLGLGAADSVTGITPEAYAQNIINNAYAIANNGKGAVGVTSTSNKTASQAAKGPQITVASGNNQKPIGC